jgi:hypothetical protein
LAATGFFTVWVAILSLPMLAGRWLAGPWSDQYSAGYAFRTWGAEQLRRTGHVPLWNPEMFGGLPFVAAMHGDIFYPTSWLRVLLSMPVVMNLGFVIHYIAAGLFTYFLLRRLKVSWTASVVGGIAYQLSGLIASYPSPGHDGKLFVSALLPLALLALVLAITERRWSGYALLALTVGLALLSPHFQMTYYMLIATGLFALYVTFGDQNLLGTPSRVRALALALGAVVLGFGVAAIQILPFLAYLPFSPRAQGFHGFEGATSYAIPWAHVPEFLLKSFTGVRETYWGPNGLKLHSEYLGLPVIALAILGVGAGKQRRLMLWLGGIGLLFLLISLGASTPFYQAWWALMPYVKQTRAPGMAFFVVALVVAVLAALGVERLERKEEGLHPTFWFVAAGAIALLAIAGAFSSMAVSLATGLEASLGRPLADAAAASRTVITWGAASSALALAGVAAIALAWRRGRLTGPLFSILLAGVVGTDLWLNARAFWVYSDGHPGLFARDSVTDRIQTTPLPFRVLDLGVYPTSGSALMAFGIPTVLGHHGFELNRYDELLGGQGQWRHLASLPLWDLLAVRYVIVPAQGRALEEVLPGFAERYRKLLANVPTSAGVAANLYERVAPAPFARVVSGAVKLDTARIIPTLLDPRLDPDRLLLMAPGEPANPPPMTTMPDPSPSRATITRWEPGHVILKLEPAPPAPSYILVAENWYPDWRATVDGSAVPTLRGDQTFLTVAVPAGAKQVELEFRSASYTRGRMVSVVSLLALGALLVVPVAARRSRRG